MAPVHPLASWPAFLHRLLDYPWVIADSITPSDLTCTAFSGNSLNRSKHRNQLIE